MKRTVYQKRKEAARALRLVDHEAPTLPILESRRPRSEPNVYNRTFATVFLVGFQLSAGGRLRARSARGATLLHAGNALHEPADGRVHQRQLRPAFALHGQAAYPRRRHPERWHRSELEAHHTAWPARGGLRRSLHLRLYRPHHTQQRHQHIRRHHAYSSAREEGPIASDKVWRGAATHCV